MEPFFPTVWDVLHDGGISRIDGSVPGDVQVFVDIEYLRKRFSDDGETIIVTLTDCTLLTYRPYDAKVALSDLAAIAGESFSILNAELDGSKCRVFTDGGVLELRCGGGSLSLDSGRSLSLTELLEVAESYWEEFGLRPGNAE